MLTPMMVQYLVGLCCLGRDPEAVDVTIGDMVFDEAAEKERDVDVTVTIVDEHGEVTAFKAAEVKHEGKPVDVATVEQLIAKLTDMPKITHKAIFSTAGYTDGARTKARKRGVNLYTLQPWENPIGIDFPDFLGVGTPSEFLFCFRSHLLYWHQYKCTYSLPATSIPNILDLATRTVDSSGKPHPRWPTLGGYQKDLLLRSTGILCTQDVAQAALQAFPHESTDEEAEFTMGPEWPHTHTLDIERDDVHLVLKDGSTVLINEATITGLLQWRRRTIKPNFMILKDAFDNSAFSGAAITHIGTDDGRMFALIFPEKGRQLSIHRFQIPDKQRNMIRKLSIKDTSYLGGYRVSRRQS